MVVKTINPRWIGDTHVWDITADGEVITEGVSEKEIFSTMRKAHDLGFCTDFEARYGSCFGVRQCHVVAYAKTKIIESLAKGEAT